MDLRHHVSVCWSLPRGTDSIVRTPECGDEDEWRQGEKETDDTGWSSAPAPAMCTVWWPKFLWVRGFSALCKVKSDALYWHQDWREHLGRTTLCSSDSPWLLICVWPKKMLLLWFTNTLPFEDLNYRPSNTPECWIFLTCQWWRNFDKIVTLWEPIIHTFQCLTVDIFYILPDVKDSSCLVLCIHGRGSHNTSSISCIDFDVWVWFDVTDPP